MNSDKQYKILDDVTFKKVYSDEKFRNEVAFAVNYADSTGKILGIKTVNYPIVYEVTKEQIKICNNEQIKICNNLIEERKKEVLRDNKNNLLFCGMGMEFKPVIPDGIGNHRIRTEFLNDDSIRCFIEVGTAYNKKIEKMFMRCDHALMYYPEKISNENREGEVRLSIERNLPETLYTFENLLKLVNETFNCSFKKIVLDEYNISCDGVLCRSIKEEKSECDGKPYHTEYMLKKNHLELLGKRAKFKEDSRYTKDCWGKSGTIIQHDGVEHVGISLKFDNPIYKGSTITETLYIMPDSIELI